MEPDPRQTEQQSGLDGAEDGDAAEALDQSSHESLFANKYLGIYRRESSGRFGSIPLYDDYGDDADAD